MEFSDWKKYISHFQGEFYPCRADIFKETYEEDMQ